MIRERYASAHSPLIITLYVRIVDCYSCSLVNLLRTPEAAAAAQDAERIKAAARFENARASLRNKVGKAAIAALPNV